MKAYLSLFKLRFNMGLQYKAAAIAGLVTQFFWGLMLIMIYRAYYANEIEQAISLEQIVTYIWLQQAFLLFVILWSRDNEICNMIIKGNIAYELCRPVNLYWFWYSKSLATRISKAILRCVPVIIFAIFLPIGFKLMPPVSIISFILFLVTLILGLLVNIGILVAIYISMFYTMSVQGSFVIFAILGEFLAGGVIPIPFMPKWLQTICYIFPFRLASDLPFRVYSGNIEIKEALISILVQLLWIFALTIIGNKILKNSLKKVVVHGG